MAVFTLGLYMDRQFGQILDKYEFRGEWWVSIWDFDRQARFDTNLVVWEAVRPGMLVEITRVDGKVFEVALIDADGFVGDADPILPVVPAPRIGGLLIASRNPDRFQQPSLW